MIAAADIVAVTLAAGRSQRFGGAKLDALLDGDQVGTLAHRALLGRTWRGNAIVVPPVVPLYAKPLEKNGVELLINAASDAGLSSSLAIAVGFARTTGARGLLVTLADMPFVSTGTIDKLLLAIDDRGGRTMAAVRYPSMHEQPVRHGPPALFAACWFTALENLQGDQGARSLLSEHAQLVAGIEPDDHELLDIDTTDDLAIARQRCQSNAGLPRRESR